jgi:exosome complex component RRP4
VEISYGAPEVSAQKYKLDTHHLATTSTYMSTQCCLYTPLTLHNIPYIMLQIQSVPPIPLFHAEEPQTYSKTRHHPDLDSSMDSDDEDLGIGSSKNITSPGQMVTSAKEFMRGHGTYVEEDNVMSTVAGTIERVNKLVSVRSVRQRYVWLVLVMRPCLSSTDFRASRYNPEKGDLVVGRVVEVVQQRWKVDANARQDAILALSSVNLPGGVQVSFTSH